MTSNGVLHRGYRNNGFGPDELDPFYQYERPSGGVSTRNAVPPYGARDGAVHRCVQLLAPDRKVGRRAICMTMVFLSALAVILLIGLAIFAALYFSGLQASGDVSTAVPSTVESTSVAAGTNRTPLSGQVTMDVALTMDRDFQNEFNDPTSAEYQELENAVTTWVDALLGNSDVRAVYLQNSILGFSEGSVRAALRLRFREAVIDAQQRPSDLNIILQMFVEDVQRIFSNAIDQPGCCPGLGIIRSIVNSANIEPPPIDGVNPQPTVPRTSAPMAPPTAVPTMEQGTASPTDPPTAAPPNPPTAAPTGPPTAAPPNPPTAAPTDPPTAAPPNPPTAAPTDPPTAAPPNPPTAAPTDQPTAAPPNPPIVAPTDPPTAAPPNPPTAAPTDPPSAAPSDQPTAAPTDPPTSSTKLPSFPTTPGTNEALNITVSSSSPSVETTAVPPDPYSLVFVAGDSRIYSALADQFAFIVATQGLNVFLENPVAVDYDPVDGMVYWTDTQTGSIYRLLLGGTFADVLVTDLHTPEGLCLDTENRVMYWTDAGSNLIERVTFEGMERSVVLNLTEEHGHPIHPRGIILDPMHSNLYWTDRGTFATIERVSTNGTSRTVIVDTGLFWPNGLTLDQQGGRIYWCEAYYSRFESADLSGQNRRVLVEFSADRGIRPFDVFIHKDYLFWTSSAPDANLFRFELDSPEPILDTVGSTSFDSIYGLHFYEDHFADHSCVDFGPCGVGERCRQFATSYQCVCRDGLEGDACQLLTLVTENITLATNETVELTSPGYPENYPRDISVTWVLKTEENWKIRLIFPNANPSTKDVWRVGNGADSGNTSSLVATWLQNSDVSDVLSAENVAWVTHRKYFPLAERKGFMIIATSVPSSETPNCGADEFQCGNSVCLNGELECNLFPECADGSDELECDGCNTTSYINAEYNSSVSIYSTRGLKSNVPYCRWSITGPANAHIGVHILQYHLQGTYASLRFSYLDGETGTDFEPGRLDPGRLLFKRNVILIEYVSLVESSLHLAIEALRPQDYVECEVYPYIYLHDEACDRIVQCPNGDDEMDCECEADEHQCQNGICVSPTDAECSGTAECLDWSDEGTSCYEGYCTVITEASPCAVVLPYNATFFPNDFMLSQHNAEEFLTNHLDQFTADCSADERLALCMAMFPECPRFGTDRRVCASLCSDALQCLGFGVNSTGLQCDVYPDNSTFSTAEGCLYDEDDIMGIGDCGRRPAASPDLNPYSRIINGAESHIANWPWIASMRWPNGSHGCAATLITTQWAITAAHCVPFLPYLVFGSSTLEVPVDYPDIRGIAKTVPHPRYSSASLMDDIALVKLAAPVAFRDTILPACLEHDGNEEERYQKCHVVGWGRTSPDNFSLVLKEGRVPLVAPRVCKDLVQHRLFVSTHQICAGISRDRNGTCHGDSGGPLICQAADGRWKLVGVASAVVTCGGAETTDLFTRVSKYIDFIRHTIASDSDVCSPNEFQCGNSACIDAEKQCNGFPECPDASDEADCHGCNTTSNIDASFNSSFSIYSTPALRFTTPICAWIIRAPDDAHVAIHIIDYHIEDDTAIYFGHGEDPYTDPILKILRNGPHDVGHLGFAVDRVSIFYFPWVTAPLQFHLGIQAVTIDDYVNCEARPYIYLNDERCDRISQCPNEDDEKDCECLADEHKCANGVCVSPIDAKCNGLVDCKDFSDEGLGCYEDYCIAIANAVCLAVLPYNMTFFPNDFVVSNQQADEAINDFLPQLTTNCTENQRLALCMAFYPECPRFGSGRRVCASLCADALECVGLSAGATSLQCEVYPNKGVLSTPEGCNYDDGDIVHAGECGTRPAASQFRNPYSRIIDGAETHIVNWPWIASYRYPSGQHGCGAALIKPQWAVTAAHCDRLSYLVLGISTSERPSTYPHVRVVQRIDHPGWSSAHFNDDIALLKLEAPVPYTDTIQPACLEHEENEVEKYDDCHVVGWGKTEEEFLITSPVLKEARVPLVPMEQCKSYGMENFLFLSSNQICAGSGGGGNNTCRGDSGGPLVCQRSDGHWNLVGLTSTLINCRGFEEASVYTRISKYIDFIRYTIATYGD